MRWMREPMPWPINVARGDGKRPRNETNVENVRLTKKKLRKLWDLKLIYHSEVGV